MSVWLAVTSNSKKLEMNIFIQLKINENVLFGLKLFSSGNITYLRAFIAPKNHSKR